MANSLINRIVNKVGVSGIFYENENFDSLITFAHSDDRVARVTTIFEMADGVCPVINPAGGCKNTNNFNKEDEYKKTLEYLEISKLSEPYLFFFVSDEDNYIHVGSLHTPEPEPHEYELSFNELIRALQKIKSDE